MNITELDKETIKKLGLDQEYKKATRKPRVQKFSKEQVRSNALKALGLLAAFSQDERRRILNHAIQLNEV
mgnify:FL=1|tara:strand:- start:752 stop:961 length:210 start_codon:yes stop_codon:yes gene_type:complete